MNDAKNQALPDHLWRPMTQHQVLRGAAAQPHGQCQGLLHHGPERQPFPRRHRRALVRECRLWAHRTGRRGRAPDGRAELPRADHDQRASRGAGRETPAAAGIRKSRLFLIQWLRGERNRLQDGAPVPPAGRQRGRATLQDHFAIPCLPWQHDGRDGGYRTGGTQGGLRAGPNWIHSRHAALPVSQAPEADGRGTRRGVRAPARGNHHS